MTPRATSAAAPAATSAHAPAELAPGADAAAGMNELADLAARVREIVERCRVIERQSETSLAAEVLVAARVLAGKLAVLFEREGQRDAG